MNISAKKAMTRIVGATLVATIGMGVAACSSDEPGDDPGTDVDTPTDDLTETPQELPADGEVDGEG